MEEFQIRLRKKGNKRSFAQNIQSDSLDSAKEYAVDRMLLRRFNCELADYHKMGVDTSVENLLEEYDHKIYQFTHVLGVEEPVVFFIDIIRKKGLEKIDVVFKGSGYFDDF